MKQGNGGLILTDDGYTIADLRSSGYEFTAKKTLEVLHSILNGFGVQLNEDELFVNAKPGDFPQKTHSLIQAILTVNDLHLVQAMSRGGVLGQSGYVYLRL